MATSTTQPTFFDDLKRDLRDVWGAMEDGFDKTAVSIRNTLRKMRDESVDYVVIPLEGSLPERNAPPRSFIERKLPLLPPPPMTMQRLNWRLNAIAQADNVNGVLFVLRGLHTGLATAQNLRRAIQRLGEAGKKTAVFTPYLDLTHYYVATAADTIIIPPGAQFNVLGLRSEVTFYKNSLDRLGVRAQAIQISPYKSGPDPFTRADMSDEHKEQIDWLFGGLFDLLVEEMGAGRGKTAVEIKDLINRAPFFARTALDEGLVDLIAYEDEIAQAIAEMMKPDAEDVKPRKLSSWGDAYPQLMEKPRRYHKKYIGVVSLSGTIGMGPSHQPPIDLPLPIGGGAMAGEQTLLRLLRKAEKEKDMAALIFHVDTPGGSALASDLIGRQIERIGKKKPVLVYMGDVAASGGYYVSAYAKHIMSQSATITGSIGVWSIYFNTQELYEKLSLNRVSMAWGDHADLYSDAAPLTEERRKIFWDGVVESYDRFKEVVANGRSLPIDELDPICEGRVWLGTQAMAHKLVDSHGDFVDAVRKTAVLADLPIDTHHIDVINLYAKHDDHILPAAFDAADTFTEIARTLSGQRWRELGNQPLMMLPFDIRVGE